MVLKMENKIKSQKDATDYIKKKRKKTRQNKNKTFWCEEIEHVAEAKLLRVTMTKTMN